MVGRTWGHIGSSTQAAPEQRAPGTRLRTTKRGLTIFGQAPCWSPFGLRPTTAAKVVPCPSSPIVQKQIWVLLRNCLQKGQEKGCATSCPPMVSRNRVGTWPTAKSLTPMEKVGAF